MRRAKVEAASVAVEAVAEDVDEEEVSASASADLLKTYALLPSLTHLLCCLF